MIRTLTLSLLSLAFLMLTGCPGPVDDDDSAPMDDDDSASDDDDAADDDDSAGDDDDSAGDEDVPLTLDSIEVECNDFARGEHSTWNFTLNTFGWASNASLFMWDGFEWEGHHWVDPWQPFDWFDNDDWDPDQEWDQWSIELTGWDDIAEAEATGETILRCNQSNGTPNMANLNYMICAESYADGMEYCYFCGPNYGVDAGTTAVPLGTVGDFDNGVDMWSADDTAANCVLL